MRRRRQTAPPPWTDGFVDQRTIWRRSPAPSSIVAKGRRGLSSRTTSTSGRRCGCAGCTGLVHASGQSELLEYKGEGTHRQATVAPQSLRHRRAGERTGTASSSRRGGQTKDGDDAGRALQEKAMTVCRAQLQTPPALPACGGEEVARSGLSLPVQTSVCRPKTRSTKREDAGQRLIAHRSASQHRSHAMEARRRAR